MGLLLNTVTLLTKTQWADFLNSLFLDEVINVYSWANDLIDGGQPRAKPHLRKAKPNHVLKTGFSPRLATVFVG